MSGNALLILASLVAAALHELGHILMARFLKIPIERLRLDLFGARLDVTSGQISYLQEFLLCFAGPMASLVLSALFVPLWRVGVFFRLFSYASFLLGLLNLLPITSLDGGRMLGSALALYLPARALECVGRVFSFLFLFLLWCLAIYFLLRASDGLSVLFFSTSLFLHFFDSLEETKN